MKQDWSPSNTLPPHNFIIKFLFCGGGGGTFSEDESTSLMLHGVSSQA